jgi:hypothetical protein
MELVDLAQNLHHHWPVTAERPEAVTITLDLLGRRQKLVVAWAGGATVVVIAEVCYLGHLDGMDALRYNAAGQHGDLVVYGGVYALRQRWPLAQVTPEGLHAVIRAMAAEATRLGRRSRARQPSPEAVAAVYHGYLR